MGKIHSKNLLPARWKFCTETKLLEYDIPDPRHDLKSQFWTCKIMFANLTYWIFLGRTSEQEVIPCTVFDRKLSNAFQLKWSQKGKVSCWIFQTGSIWRLQFANAPITKLAAVNIDWWPSQRAMCKFCQLMLISQRPICKWWEWCEWCATFANYVQLCTIRLCTNSSAVWLSHRVLCKLYPTLY